MLRLHQFLPYSLTNGPGTRAVIWLQGCSLRCPGCFNPETHSRTGGTLASVSDLVERIITLDSTIEGITISGGEPLQQRQALLALLQRVKRETSLSVLLFTGYAWEEVQSTAAGRELLRYIDVLIAGRYDRNQHLARGLRGSANKTVHFLSNCYTLEDLQIVPSAEIVIALDGEVFISGIDPMHW